MKILEIIPQLSSGGAERFTVDLCNELARTDEVTLVVLHRLEGNNFYLSQVDEKVRVVSMEKRPGFDWRLFFRLCRLIRRAKPDVVHTHLRGIVYAFFAESGIVHGVRYVHTVHSAASKEAAEWLSRNIRRWLFRSGRCTAVTISPDSHRSFVEFYGVDAPMIPNGRNVPQDLEVSEGVKAEFRAYRVTERTRVVVCLARIDPVKRQTLLARVADRLCREGRDLTLLLIGSTKIKELVQEIEALQCPRIHVLGERQNPLEYLKAADAYCLFSSYEGLPISLIEALGVGCVPVCTPAGGMKNLIADGRNGLLAPGFTEEACYATLRRFLDLPAERLAQMKAAALESYAPYSMSECARRYRELFGK